MTEKQHVLLERANKLLFCANDTRLRPEERAAAFYKMVEYREILDLQGIKTNGVYGRIIVTSEIC